MNKRKLEEDFETDWRDKEIRPDPKKNSLDSDEDDEVDEEKYTVMNDDEIEGQEEGVAGFDGETTITPFNMKEELEEGHFDTDGNYHWKKEGRTIRDNWLENIDWIKIKKIDKELKPNSEDSDSDDSMPSPFDHIPIYKEILSFLKPGETIVKAICRLGGNKTTSASERWKRKKAGLDTNESPEQREQVMKVTELANKLLTETGNMDIYQESFEYISDLIKKSDKTSKAEDSLDMYADDFDEKEKARLGEKKQEGEVSTTQDTKSKSDEVTWEFKWQLQSEDVNGPHTTEQMQAWVDEGYFKSEVWVRRCGQEGPFYNSKRVDFELYL